MKTRDVDTLILGAINTCWTTPITMGTLLALIHGGKSPGALWIGPVGQLFAEVPATAVKRWAGHHQLPAEQLATYFDQHVRPWNVLNPDLEEWLYGQQPVGHSV